MNPQNFQLAFPILSDVFGWLTRFSIYSSTATDCDHRADDRYCGILSACVPHKQQQALSAQQAEIPGCILTINRSRTRITKLSEKKCLLSAVAVSASSFSFPRSMMWFVPRFATHRVSVRISRRSAKLGLKNVSSDSIKIIPHCKPVPKLYEGK